MGIAPSLICADLCNLERDVEQMSAIGCRMLHVDIIDGYFSPSMPIGLDTVRQLRGKTSLIFDVHVMAKSCAYFIDELLDIGAERVCFQIESEPTPSILLQRIRHHGAEAGIALAPSTPVRALEYLIEECNHVLLMQIDPGYASLCGTEKRPYMERKITELRELIAARNPAATIEIDGRVSVEDMPALKKLGVSTFVSGTGGFFRKDHTWKRTGPACLRR